MKALGKAKYVDYVCSGGMYSGQHGCGERLRISPADIQSSTGSDRSGVSDTTHFITCSVCHVQTVTLSPDKINWKDMEEEEEEEDVRPAEPIRDQKKHTSPRKASAAQKTGTARVLEQTDGNFFDICREARRRHAGQGRLGSLPDILHLRTLENGEQTICWHEDIRDFDDEHPSLAWNRSWTTASAIYIGTGIAGSKRVIIAHNDHPLLHHASQRRSGILAQNEFNALEAGEYGAVSVFDMDALTTRIDPRQEQNLSLESILAEAFFQALLGDEWKSYAQIHHDLVIRWYGRGRGGAGRFSEPTPLNPLLLTMEAVLNYRQEKNDLPHGRILHLCSLTKCSPSGTRYKTLSSEILLIDPCSDNHRSILIEGAGAPTRLTTDIR